MTKGFVVLQFPPDREPPAPTPLDEVLSKLFLESAPWVRARIKKLRIEGRLAHGWTPPRMPAPEPLRKTIGETT
jgi:hypothetical protein